MAMPLQVFLFAFFALLTSCTTTDYLGKTYPPTQHVDVFFSPQDVKRAYEVMGEIRAEGDDIVSYASMQQKLVQEAMQKGADAILIEKLDMTETGSTTVENKTRDQHRRRTSSSPVAIFATMIAAPMTSAGRFSPLGPFGSGNLIGNLQLCGIFAKVSF